VGSSHLQEILSLTKRIRSEAGNLAKRKTLALIIRQIDFKRYFI
jgi:hypothetical protein